MKILILCTGNSCRSQMAHGWLQSFDSSLTVCSAGTKASGRLNPIAVEVMAEAGVDISHHKSDSVEKYLGEEWDYVITVCGGANETCPAFTGKVKHRLHIGFDDPSEATGTPEFIRSEFIRVRDEIKEAFYKLYISMKTIISEIELKPLQSEDIPLFEKWLDKEYIYKWLCPDGEAQRESWLDEVNNKDGKYDFINHFIIYHNDNKIGYCLYADCFFLKDLDEQGHDFENLYGDVEEEGRTYEIGYLIGEEEYLNRGIGKMIIRKLEEEIVRMGGREIAADPSEENIISIKTLLSNGFKKKSDGDYRKILA